MKHLKKILEKKSENHIDGKLIVLDYSEDTGDFVYCHECDTTMLVPVGEGICPNCQINGSLMWQDDEKRETISSDELERRGEYHIISKIPPESHKKNHTTPESIVSSFFFYMWNAWSREECKETFGCEWEHFWNKWRTLTQNTTFGATENFYAELSENYREKLVCRAIQLYNRGKRIKPNHNE